MGVLGFRVGFRVKPKPLIAALLHVGIIDGAAWRVFLLACAADGVDYIQAV